MIIRGATQQQIRDAVRKANEKYGGNVEINNLKAEGHTRQGGEKWRVTLRCKSSRESGARRAAISNRRLVSACWHAHGDFMDALPAGAQIITRGMKTAPGADWQDFNVGSQWQPAMISDLCECSRR